MAIHLHPIEDGSFLPILSVKHIAKDIDVVLVCDPAVPVVDESPVHLLKRGEWTIGESDDVLMSKMRRMDDWRI